MSDKTTPNMPDKREEYYDRAFKEFFNLVEEEPYGKQVEILEEFRKRAIEHSMKKKEEIRRQTQEWEDLYSEFNALEERYSNMERETETVGIKRNY